jgi:hypothetical protein
LLPKNKFKMAAKLKTKTTKTKFACKNYKSSFFKKKNSVLFWLPEYLNFIEKKFLKNSRFAYNQHGDFFWNLFLGALILVRNFKMVKFLHILEVQ